SLEALQAAALTDNVQEVADWLGARGLSTAPRLAEALRVASGWEMAVEVVLGETLQAVLVPELDPLRDTAGAIAEGQLTLMEGAEGAAIGSGVSTMANAPSSPSVSKIALSELIESGAPAVAGRVAGIYACEGLADAVSELASLAPNESIVTRSGLWLGPNWMRVMAGSDAEHGVLAREQALREVRDANDEAGQVSEQLNTEFEDVRLMLRDEEGARSEAQSALAQAQNRYAALRSDVSKTQAEVDQREQRAQNVQAELLEVNVAREAAQGQVEQAQIRLDEAALQTTLLEQERGELQARRAVLEQGLSQAREHWQSLRQGAYDRGLAIESTRSQITALEEASARVGVQVDALQERCTHLAGELEGLGEPLAVAEVHRQNVLARHAELEGSLREARTGLEAGEAKLRELEHTRLSKEGAVSTERERLGAVQLAAQESAVRRQTVLEQLQEHGDDVVTLMENIEQDASEVAWVERLEQLDRRISRLGPINLAAIDEFEQQSERKAYLDAQHADLTEALDTLQEAIRKIDQDTRSRFKDTYERVNAGLEEKFPRLFGGGSAYLQLTSEDLLETGVVVMARPPGKRNSSIHLLSGGEKAMTAVALVFSIFDLNPAPFCLLDEVDAPLDDANVGRFANIVREMSEQVQMLFVTHNKATMECAQQLIGVTMSEPGVSRLVAVDLNSAVELVAD
ncbi:MAG: chromosome segregation protein, partial [Gammaproteobacteria bacterium]